MTATLDEITGMGDVIRGAGMFVGQGPMTATEASSKTHFASLRSQAMQDRFSRFASELQALGVVPGNLTSIAFDLVTANGDNATLKGYTIKLDTTGGLPDPEPAAGSAPSGADRPPGATRSTSTTSGPSTSTAPATGTLRLTVGGRWGRTRRRTSRPPRGRDRRR